MMKKEYNKVIIADDDPVNLKLLREYLEPEGYSVAQACNGQQALDLIEEAAPPHFLITDLEMSVMNGIELCERVRDLNLDQRVYVLFLTGCISTDNLISALESGADGFMTKPVTKRELLARMRSGVRLLAREDHLIYRATTDLLTQLPTRRSFSESFQREWHRTRRYHRPLSCVMFDVDFFKKVNDSYGHSAGDAVLRAVADLFQQNCRNSDIICRYGGEEFCAVLPETDEPSAEIWADRLRQRISDERVPLDDHVVNVTASFGVAEMIADMETPEELIEIADQCLMVAKQRGRDRVVKFIDCYQGALADREKDSIFAGFQAKHVMSINVMRLEKTTTISQITKYFLESRISSAPVVDEKGQLIGIVSEKDLMNVIGQNDNASQTIDEVMRTNVISYDEQTPVHTIFEFLCRVTIRTVIIVKDGVPVGFIGRHSFLRWFDIVMETRSVVKSAQCEFKVTSIAESISRQALMLKESMRNREEYERNAQIAGSASRMQELINDLLVASGHEHKSTV